MTPKQKAKELVDKFDGVGLQMRNEAIACALICVHEMMKLAIWNDDVIYNYLQEVKEEIELL